MAEFKLGLFGGGIIARAHVAAAKASAGRVKIAAIVDPSDAARKTVGDATGARQFASAEEFFGAARRERLVDGVMVCTPPNARLPIVRAALAQDLAVFVEKPLAHTLDEARGLVDLAAKHPNLATIVGYCHRFVPAVIEMKKQIDDGSLGKVVRFENIFASWNPAMKQRWTSDPAISGGGSLIDTGSHSLDLFAHLFGPATVECAVVHHEWPGRGESNATLLLRGNGQHNRVTGVIQSGWLEPARFTITVVGTAGLLHYDYDKPRELLHRRSEGGGEVIAVESHELRFERQINAFADIAQGRTPSVNLASFADGLRVAEHVDEAMKRATVI